MPSKTNARTSPKLNWRMKHVSSYGGAVPAVAGWYAIGHDEHYFGLESSRIYVYIGTTDNLRRRLAEHQPSTEQNPGLKRYLQKNFEHAKCWYTSVPKGASKANLRIIEAKLIAKFKPCFNRQGIR